jgi:hypothetical protein
MLRRLFFSLLWAICSLSVTFYIALMIMWMLRNDRFFVNGGGALGEIVLLFLFGTPFLLATFVFLFGMRGRLPGTSPKGQPRR